MKILEGMSESLEEKYMFKDILNLIKVYLWSCTSSTLLVQGTHQYYDPKSGIQTMQY